MTLVDAETGEVVEPLDVAGARDLTDAITGQLESTWDLVVEAYQRQAHAALGYDSWNHYCTQEFGASSLKLPKEDRRDTVASLRDAGLSIRAISAATGAAKSTVENDIKQVSRNGTPDVEPRFKKSQITGTDGKSYSKTTTRRSTSTTTETAPPAAGEEGKGTATRPAPSEPDDAEKINGAFANGVDPVLEYRAKFSKKLDAAFQIVSADIDRAAQSCEGPERARVKRIREWCDQYLDATKANHLRSV